MKKQHIVAGVLALGIFAAAAVSFGLDRAKASQRDKSMDGWGEYTVYWFDLFDTVTRVVGYAPTQEAWTEQIQALHEDLLFYHKAYDIYNSYEDVVSLQQVNEHAMIAPVAVPVETIDMLQLGIEMNEVTHGKLNIAMGSMLQLWHEYRDAGIEHPESAQLPPYEELSAAMISGNLNNLILKAENNTVFFADSGFKLDVGSVGKGFAVEQAAKRAQERGLSSAFISVGGNLRAIGHKPDGSEWIGGVENARDTGTPVAAVVLSDGKSLVTSGDYQRYYTVDGQNYCHLIDPDTLYPAVYFRSVSVLADDSGIADCLSTGLFCMNLEEGQELVDSLPGVEALWQNTDGSLTYSEGFKAQLAK